MAELESHIAAVTGYVASCEGNHEGVGVSLALSKEVHRSEGLDAGYVKSAVMLACDKEVTAWYEQGIGVDTKIMNDLVTARAQMVGIADYAVAEIKTFEAAGQTQEAEDEKTSAKNEINGLGRDLAVSIKAAIASLGGGDVA